MAENEDTTMVRIKLDVMKSLKDEASGENRSATMQLDHILRQRYKLTAKSTFDVDEATRQIKDQTELDVAPNGEENLNSGNGQTG